MGNEDISQINFGNINPDLLILQNQINQAAQTLRPDDPVTGESIALTDQHIANSASL